MFSISTLTSSLLLLHFTPVPNGFHHARHLAFISEITTDICHINGHANHVAAALSCNALALEQSPIDLDTLDSAQDKTKMRSSSSFPTPRLSHSRSTLLCDISLGHPHLLVHLAMRQAIFDHLHSLSHPDIKASCPLILERYVWPNMTLDIACWTRACHDCQQSKVQRHVKAQLKAFTLHNCCFYSIHADIVGPLPPSKGYTLLSTSGAHH